MAYLLICDDEPHITRAVEIKLRRAGHRVEAHGDGRAAWDALLDIIGAGQPLPQLIITDCQMPRMTGLQLAAAIKAEPRLRGLPIVMLTAKGFELSAVELKEKLGICRVVGKPFSPRELSELVEVILDGTFEGPAYRPTAAAGIASDLGQLPGDGPFGGGVPGDSATFDGGQP